jgi:hypothetical protein
MRVLATLVLSGLVLTMLPGCSQKMAEPAARGGNGAAERVVGAAIPPSSPLAKVKIGMDKRQVREILGMPNDENTYATGKAFIPFYFGNDSRRSSWYYKGAGRVVFADGNVFGGGGNEVVRVDYDPNETGIAPR